MQITIFSILMTMLWGSVLILLFYVLRTKFVLLNLCSVSGVIILYLFCLIRMMVPVEFPWTKVITGGVLYNKAYDILYCKLDIGISISVYIVLLMAWISGTAFILLRDTIRYIRIVRCFGRMPTQGNSKETEILDKIWNGEIKKPDIIRTAAIDTPCCMGILRKRIVIPDRQYSEEKLYYILLHEYTHLKNRDILTINLTNILCALYWWNPCVYLLKKDLNQSMEIRCDAVAVKGLGDEAKSEYLTVALEEFKCSIKKENDAGYSNAMMQLFHNSSELLLERFKLVAAERNGYFKKGNIIAWIIAGCLLLLSYSFVIQTKYSVPESEIVIDQDTYEVDSNNSYLIKKHDGSYLFHSQDGDIPIDDETAEMMIMDGFMVIEDRE